MPVAFLFFFRLLRRAPHPRPAGERRARDVGRPVPGAFRATVFFSFFCFLCPHPARLHRTRRARAGRRRRPREVGKKGAPADPSGWSGGRSGFSPHSGARLLVTGQENRVGGWAGVHAVGGTAAPPRLAPSIASSAAKTKPRPCRATQGATASARGGWSRPPRRPPPAAPPPPPYRLMPQRGAGASTRPRRPRPPRRPLAAAPPPPFFAPTRRGRRAASRGRPPSDAPAAHVCRRFCAPAATALPQIGRAHV